MSQSSNQSEQDLNEKNGAANAPADASASADVSAAGSAAGEGKNENLAFTNPDEYKHKHGEHKHGEHHHHHHHHHHHRHFHLFNLSISGIRDNLKLLFKSIYTYPYMLLFLSLLFLFFMNSGLALKLLNARKAGFSSLETYYQWEEYLVMNKSVLARIPFQFTLVVAIAILLYLMYQQERHWQRNAMKILPALGGALIFSLPMGGGRPAEEFARSACRDSLRNYHIICIEYADLNDGAFPDALPEKPSAAAKYGADHFIYNGAGKTAKDEAFILLEDKDGSHIGNYRYAIQSDGVLLVAKYGGLYEEYKSQKQPADQASE